MSKERLGAFMDAVIAIVMTILVLELEKPAKPTLEAFWDLRINFATYQLKNRRIASQTAEKNPALSLSFERLFPDIPEIPHQ